MPGKKFFARKQVQFCLWKFSPPARWVFVERSFVRASSFSCSVIRWLMRNYFPALRKKAEINLIYITRKSLRCSFKGTKFLPKETQTFVWIFRHSSTSHSTSSAGGRKTNFGNCSQQQILKFAKRQMPFFSSLFSQLPDIKAEFLRWQFNYIRKIFIGSRRVKWKLNMKNFRNFSSLPGSRKVHGIDFKLI